MMPKILITGSSGFLGSQLIKNAPPGYRVIGHYCRNMPVISGRSPEVISLDLLQADWPDLENVEPDVIIHTAAMASIDQCETQSEKATAINHRAAVRLARLAGEKQIRFIFISSDVIFDGKRGNYAESDAPHPINVYARTKIDAENDILKICPKAVIVRPSLFYGLALNGRPSFTEIMLKNLYAGKQVYVFADQFRTPISVRDLAKAIWELADHSFSGIVHVGGPERLSRLDMANILCKTFNLDESLLIPIRSSEARLAAVRPLDCALNSSLARSILKTEIQDFRTGLHMTFG